MHFLSVDTGSERALLGWWVMCMLHVNVVIRRAMSSWLEAIDRLGVCLGNHDVAASEIVDRVGTKDDIAFHARLH